MAPRRYQTSKVKPLRGEIHRQSAKVYDAKVLTFIHPIIKQLNSYKLKHPS